MKDVNDSRCSVSLKTHHAPASQPRIEEQHQYQHSKNSKKIEGTLYQKFPTHMSVRFNATSCTHAVYELLKRASEALEIGMIFILKSSRIAIVFMKAGSEPSRKPSCRRLGSWGVVSVYPDELSPGMLTRMVLS